MKEIRTFYRRKLEILGKASIYYAKSAEEKKLAEEEF